MLAGRLQSQPDVDEGKQPQPFLDRPVRSLLNLKIGTVLKAYLIYIAIAFVLGLLALAVVLATWDRGGSPSVLPNGIRWTEGAGETVTPAEYRSVGAGALLDAVRSRLGEPATKGHNPFDLVSGDQQSCLGYRSSASESTLFMFCFEGGRLVDKKAF